MSKRRKYISVSGRSVVCVDAVEASTSIDEETFRCALRALAAGPSGTLVSQVSEDQKETNTLDQVFVNSLRNRLCGQRLA